MVREVLGEAVRASWHLAVFLSESDSQTVEAKNRNSDHVFPEVQLVRVSNLTSFGHSKSRQSMFSVCSAEMPCSGSEDQKLWSVRSLLPVEEALFARVHTES